MNPLQEFAYRARSSGAPVTVAIVAGMILGFLVSFFTMGRVLYPTLAFSPADAFAQPWSFVLFPFAYPPSAIFSIVFGGLWLWGIGGSVERELGSTRHALLFFGAAFLAAFGVWLGSIGMNASGALATAWIPTAAVTVAWGTRNPNAPLTFMFVLPLTGRWLAWLSAIFVFFGTSAQLAPFTLPVLVLAWAWAAEKLPFLPWSGYRPGARDRKREQREQAYRDTVQERVKEREERERLRKLFESSLNDDPEERRG